MELSERPSPSVIDRVPGLILALREHRRTVAHLLAGLDGASAPAEPLLAYLTKQLRAGDDRIGVLVGRLETSSGAAQPASA